MINCHPTEISQVILNLLMNAADAIEQRYGDQQAGIIWLTTCKAEGGVIIQIRDNGCGMTEKTKERIFDPFFTTKAVGAGTGQGLSYCHTAIVSGHCGRIAVRSAEGIGTEFEIWLPCSNLNPKSTSNDSLSIPLATSNDESNASPRIPDESGGLKTVRLDNLSLEY